MNDSERFDAIQEHKITIVPYEAKGDLKETWIASYLKDGIEVMVISDTPREAIDIILKDFEKVIH